MISSMFLFPPTPHNVDIIVFVFCAKAKPNPPRNGLTLVLDGRDMVRVNQTTWFSYGPLHQLAVFFSKWNHLFKYKSKFKYFVIMIKGYPEK